MINNLKKEIIKFGKISSDRGLTPGFSGNISARCDDKILITSTGSANGFLDEDDISVIDFDGNLVEGCKKPSSEKLLHIEFYNKRPDINSIFHFHSPYLTAFAVCSKSLDECVLPEIIYCFDKIPLAKYSLPGSKDLVESTAKYFDNYDAVLMENHGVIVGGQDIKDAFLKIEICEAYAKTMVLSKFLGGAKILSEKDVEKIYDLRSK